MMKLAVGTRIHLACRPTDMRKGFNGLVADVSNVLRADTLLRGAKGKRLLYRQPD